MIIFRKYNEFLTKTRLIINKKILSVNLKLWGF